MALPAGIDTLKSTIGTRGGPAKANRFAIYMTHPQGKDGLFSSISTIAKRAVSSLLTGGSFGLRSLFEDPRDMFLLCENVTLPGRQVLTQEYATSMKFYKKPYSFVDDDVTMTFTLTEDYYCFEYFKRWQDAVIGQNGENNYTVNYKESYTTDILIQQISGGRDFIPTYGIKLKNAYPVTLNSVQLGNANDNQIASCSVTFVYDTWEKVGVVDGLIDVAQNLGSRVLSPFSDF